jgi:hypothetical protein
MLMMAYVKGWTDKRDAEREALEPAEFTSGLAVRAGRQLSTRHRERLLRAVVREILRRGAA